MKEGYTIGGIFEDKIQCLEILKVLRKYLKFKGKFDKFVIFLNFLGIFTMIFKFLINY